jgi:Holliday junction DNA helicase RuvA
MIGQLTGTLLDCAPDRALLDVAGVGYELRIPLSTYYALSNGAREGVRLHVHTHVREDALQLYGFATRDERTLFERLIAISGVGPRMALAILSGIGVDELPVAVRDQDRGRLEKIPGVGKKTAERLLLELRDKLKVPEGSAPRGAAGADLRPDAVSALVNLGYPRDAAGRAVDRALGGPSGPATLEAVLRLALAGLVR